MTTKVNEIKLCYKDRISIAKSPKITCSQDAANLYYKNWDKNEIQLHESFKVMLLNNSNIVKGICQISAGGITATLVDLRIMFALVLKSLATAIIICHNHPSGKLQASQADKNLTAKIQKACDFLDIKLLDHIIITEGGNYLSFADERIL
ncbi:JAB domain-containing protein [Zunongwangia sp. SCSIO 43204]|uniref:JAB domain-containing protein n=1 Tax=Zunongwangia sp. SCSIO 43204 TaxID=2779359 RepID=UPI001CA92858|nr:JAB domain-containing protein [Zunongwangia sp. SCSIO 43204]UAB84136.1 JAB domain-containing protein [Zunongwangia sp. SCSIO 43204]